MVTVLIKNQGMDMADMQKFNAYYFCKTPAKSSFILYSSMHKFFGEMYTFFYRNMGQIKLLSYYWNPRPHIHT